MSQSALSFPDGGTALLFDPNLVPVKRRRPYERAKMAMGKHAVTAQELSTDEDEQQKYFVLALADNPDIGERIADTAILALVAEWSYGEVTQAVLDELPSSTYDALAVKCAALAPQMSPNFAVSDDPKAISRPSTGSGKSGPRATTTKHTNSR